jgi:hypothetical protein
MPLKKVHLDCSEFYCDHWQDGGCEANEPVEELNGNEFCRYISYSSTSDQRRNLPGGLYVRVLELSKHAKLGMIQAAKKAGVATHVIDRDGKEFVAVARMPGRRAISVFKVRDISNMILFPCVDGSVGWRCREQVDLFEGVMV